VIMGMVLGILGIMMTGPERHRHSRAGRTCDSVRLLTDIDLTRPWLIFREWDP
jgi:hypothetical protein